VLILGGTTEARELAELAVKRWGSRIDLITSLAGRTAAPVRLAGRVRRGGFGGAAGLADFLRRKKIDYLVDATHPFAERISRHAAAAAAAAGVAHLTLTRPPWRPGTGDRWIEVDDAAQAAAALPALGRRAWLTVGRGDFAAFAELEGVWFLVRRVDPPQEPLPLRDHTLILGRGPFAAADERALLTEYRIEVLVCRASGGAATSAKLAAAREARLPVVMIRRPAATAGPAVASPRGALAWLARRISA
jgi:precorrin-6A/cobalt-precorrin-6A reductase